MQKGIHDFFPNILWFYGDSTLRVLVVCEGHPTPDGVGGLNPYRDVVIVGGGVDRPVVIPTIRMLI